MRYYISYIIKKIILQCIYAILLKNYYIITSYAFLIYFKISFIIHTTRRGHYRLIEVAFQMLLLIETPSNNHDAFFFFP